MDDTSSTAPVPGPSAERHALRVELDEAQRARERAEHALAEAVHLLDLVAHEMRTPLSTIDMNLQLLLRDREAPLPPRHRPRLDRLVNASRRLAALVDGLLDAARLDAGRLPASREPVDLAALATAVVEDFRGAVAGPPPALRLTVQPVPRVIGDTRRLRVLLSHLLAHAMSFSSDGPVEVSLAPEDSAVALQVRHGGAGLDEATLLRLRQPTADVLPHGPGGHGGTELAVTVARRLVESLGGTLRLDSRPGEGVRFTLVLAAQQVPRLPQSGG